MKINKDLTNVLKNFANLNGGIVFEPNTNVLRSKSINADIIAWYYMKNDQEQFNVEFPILELNNLLSNLTLFADPELHFENNCLTIVDEENNSEMKYYAGYKDMIQNINTLEFKELDPVVEFEFTAEMFNTINKTAATMRVNNLGIIGDGKNIYMMVANNVHEVYQKGLTTNTFKMKIGETDKKFEVYLDIDRFKVLPLDYDLKVCLQRGRLVLELDSNNLIDGEEVHYYVLPLEMSKIEE